MRVSDSYRHFLRWHAQQQEEGWDAFTVGKQLRSDYDAFMAANGIGERAITDCLVDILAWRYAYRHVYATLPFVQKSGDGDKQDLLGAHGIFLKDIGEIADAAALVGNAKDGSRAGKPSLRSRIFRLNGPDPKIAQASPEKSDIPKARLDILKQVIERQPSDGELAFFSEYCHDSYAGFKPFDVLVAGHIVSRNMPWEDGGYLQYRTRYAGKSLRLAMLETCPPDSENAAAA